MDNKAYLDQIAVKGKVKSGPGISPFIIKLIAAGLIVLITLFIVGSVISGSNSKTTQVYERVYLRITTLTDSKSPIVVYKDKVKDSTLRSYTDSFISSLKSTSNTLANLTDSIGIDAKKISKAVTDEETANTDDLTSSFEQAVLTGTLDRTLATKVAYQVNILLLYEQQARAKTPNAQFAQLLDNSIKDLTTLQEQFQKYNEGK